MAIFNFRKVKKSAESPGATVQPVEQQRPEPATRKLVLKRVGSQSFSVQPQNEDSATVEDREQILARMRKANDQKRHEFLHSALEEDPEQLAIASSPLKSPVESSFDDILSAWRNAHSANGCSPLTKVKTADSSPEGLEDSACRADSSAFLSEKDFAISHHSDSGYDSYAVSRASSEGVLWAKSSVSSLGHTAKSSRSSSVYSEGNRRDSQSINEDIKVDALSPKSTQMPKSETDNDPMSSPDLTVFRPQRLSRPDLANMMAPSRHIPPPIITRHSSLLRPASLSLPPPSPPPNRPLPSPPTHRLSVLQGFKVNKAGRVLNEEGEVIGELVSGDILDCVRQRIDNQGQVRDGHNKVVGMVNTVDSATRAEKKHEVGADKDIEEDVDNVSPISSARDSVLDSPVQPRHKQTQSRRLSTDLDHEFEQPRDVPLPPRHSLSRTGSTASNVPIRPAFKHERTPSSLSAAPGMSVPPLSSRHQGNASDILQFSVVPYSSTVTPRSASRSRSSVRERVSALSLSRPSTSHENDHTVSDYAIQFPSTPTSPARRTVDREHNPFINSRSKAVSMLPPASRVMTPVPEDIVPKKSAEGVIPSDEDLPATRPTARYSTIPSPFDDPKFSASRRAKNASPRPAIPPRSAARPSSVQLYASMASSDLRPTESVTSLAEEKTASATSWAALYPAPPIPTGGMMGVYGAHSRPVSVKSNMTGKTNVTVGATAKPRGKAVVDVDGEQDPLEEETALKRVVSTEKANGVVEKQMWKFVERKAVWEEEVDI